MAFEGAEPKRVPGTIKRPAIADVLAAADHQRQDVLSRFPVEDWPSMPLERYALGTGAAEPPYCAMLEYRTPDLGSIRGGSAAKHIIYQKRDGQWRLPAPLQELPPHDAWERLRAQFVTAFEAAAADDFDVLDDLNLLWHGQSLVTKSLSVYVPTQFLPISAADHLRHFIRQFGAEPEANAAAWRLNRQLRDLVADHPKLHGWSPIEVMHLLYDRFAPAVPVTTPWKIAPGERASLWDQCRDGSFICIGWAEVGDLSKYPTKSDLQQRLEELPAQSRGGQPARVAGELLRFRDLEPGTRVLANRGQSQVLAVGTVTTAGYSYVPDEPYPHRVGVDWDTTFAQTLDNPQAGWRSTFGTVSQQLWASIQNHRVGAAAPEPEEPEMVRRVRSHLERKGQVILYGPPGTGKTRLALDCALALTGDTAALTLPRDQRRRHIDDMLATPDQPDDRPADEDRDVPTVSMLTFHPSYGYEDFVESFKPTPTASNGLVLKLSKGFFMRVCTTATKHPDRMYLLIIDEINRADLPRVFGELITLLEPDKRGLPVVLPVSGRSFQTPPNVRIIGTMNTADRSVAHLDAAIRRRFGFVQVPPNPDVLAGVIGALDLGRLLSAVNDQITHYLNADHTIGHSFFLRDDQPIATEEDLHTTWYDEVIPLLEDYVIGDGQLLTDLLGTELVDQNTGRVNELPPDDLIAALAAQFPTAVADDTTEA